MIHIGDGVQILQFGDIARLCFELAQQSDERELAGFVAIGCGVVPVQFRQLWQFTS
jgi:hypothetical protein